MRKQDIRARVLWNWGHFNSKFLPGLHAIVNEDVKADWNSKRRMNPFTMNDISSSDIYQYVVRKLMYKLTP